MKTKKVIILVVFSLLFSGKNVFSQQAWEYVFLNQSGTTLEITRLQFLSDKIGFALFGSQIQKTTDGGTTWAKVSDLPTGVGIKGMWCLDENNVIIVGQSGKIFKSTNGGTTWSSPKPISVGSTIGQNPVTRYLNNIIFTDANTAYVFGNFGTLLKSTDAGETWTRQFDESSAADQRHFNAGMFSTTGVLYIAASWGYMYKMKDGVLSYTFNNKSKSAENFGVYAFTDDKAQVVGYGSGSGNSDILTTVDGGATWLRNDDVFSNTGTLRSIAYYDANNGITVGDNGLLLTTSDGGATWKLDDTVLPVKFNAVCITPNGTTFVGGVNTIMRKNSVTAIKTIKTLPLKLFTDRASNCINIQSCDLIKQVSICNMAGVEIYNKKFDTSTALISISDLPRGVYSVSVEINGFIYKKQVIK